MTLEEIFNKAEFEGMTDEQAKAYGDEVIVVGGTDELWSYSGVALNFGDQAAEGLLQAIQGAGLVGAAQVYLTKGMQLSLSAVQEKLTAIGVSIPELAPVCDALKEIGITHGTRWQKWGVDAPTLEQITAARQGPTERQKIAHFMNAWWTPLVDNPATTVEQLRSAAATIENWNP